MSGDSPKAAEGSTSFRRLAESGAGRPPLLATRQERGVDATRQLFSHSAGFRRLAKNVVPQVQLLASRQNAHRAYVDP